MSWEISNDIGQYLYACKLAATDDSFFNRFKQDGRYRQILEHVSLDEAIQYTKEFCVSNSEVLKYLDKFKENDLYGSPDLYDFDGLGKISPTTIRYIKNTFDIVKNFDISSIKNIVEIGGGYGGLCKTISSVIEFDNYVLFDLSEANLLSKKYISKFEHLEEKVQAFTLDELGEIDGIDLLISNYAFSEVSLDIQERYYNNIIKKSKNVYIVFNQISENNMKFDDFIDRLTSDGFDVEYSCEHEESENCNKIVYAKCLS
jgi:putative sugar O-methyltransferase